MRKRSREDLIAREEAYCMIGWSWGSIIGFWRSPKLKRAITRVAYRGRDGSSLSACSGDLFSPGDKKELGKPY
jgi:hypothetical protein